MSDRETVEVQRDDPRARLPSRGLTRETGEIVGSYRILSVLGEGSIGRVFLAEHVRLGRKVALKMLREEHASNPITVSRFFGEAKAVNQISHENIVAITDFVEEEGASYYIMELLDGHTLARALAKRRLAATRIVEIAIQIAAALDAVHAEKIVHRDLKPANIFLTSPDGKVKLLDFGVAKLTERIAGMRAVETAAGVVVGTASYMSPEQASAASIDHRTDIYALGVILYEMLTGSNPFEAKNFLESLLAQAKLTPPVPSSVEGCTQPLPVMLESLVMQCLEKSPADRPPHMRDVRVRLEQIHTELGGHPLSIAPPRARRSARPWLMPSILLIAAGLGFGAYSTTTPSEAAKQTAPAPVIEREVSPPPAPREISLQIESEPEGAEAFLIDPAQVRRSIGTTPLMHRMPPEETEHRLELELAGHHPSVRTITPARDLQVLIQLEPKREAKRERVKRTSTKRTPTRKKATPKSLDRDGVLNPFE